MNVVGATVRTVSQTVGRAADAVTSAAGAVGGAAVSGVIGGVSGTLDGMRRGLGNGSRSTPAAALTLGAVGISGLVEWPLLLAVGGGALVLRQLNRPGKAGDTAAKPARAEVPAAPVAGTATKSTAVKKSPTKARRSAPRTATARR